MSIAILLAVVLIAFLAGSETSDDKDKKTDPSPIISTGPAPGWYGPSSYGQGSLTETPLRAPAISSA
ncbi:hypothetical protein ACN24K_30680 [Streptomyces microflavus]